MHARHRSALLLGIFAFILLIARWPMNEYISDYHTWKWRPSPSEGTNFFSSVFRGGGGTPAIFAMLGGQRYMVSNIMWNYSEYLFHENKLYEMVPVFDAVVTLDPTFTEAWSTYGWHCAWNIYSYTDDPIQKENWMQTGRDVYIRAIMANPYKPTHRFDLAWLYVQREGNYLKVVNVMEPVVYPQPGFYQFRPQTDNVSHSDPDFINGRLWGDPKSPNNAGHLLAQNYQNLGVVTGERVYFEKAIKTYDYCHQLWPKDVIAFENAKRLRANLGNKNWLAELQANNKLVRANFGLPDVFYNQPAEKSFPDGDPGVKAPLPPKKM